MSRTRRRDVEIASGHSSKVKQIRAGGATRERLESLARAGY
ncbi:MAG TPA: hypothetical protein VM095_17445 [Pyrinomonadaceae bacterium]|nr:hypothetical protein [Pyrinomonadaceae bacterium]